MTNDRIGLQKTSGFLDGASLAQVSQLFDTGPTDVYSWSWQNVIEVTSLLIGTDHLYMAPGPGPCRPSSGLMNAVEGGLLERGLMMRMPFSAATTTHALKCARTWATRNPSRLRQYCEQVKSDESGSRWLQWHHNRFWPEHAARFGALFDRAFLEQIAKALEMPTTDLEVIRERSSNGERASSGAFRSTDEFKILQDAFTIAAMLRGLYHDYLARKALVQIMHHPVRSTTVLQSEESPGAPSSDSQVLYSTNTEQYLARIIVATAFSEASVHGRLGLWCDNLAKVKRAQVAQTLDLREKENDETAMTAAVDAVRKADVRVVAKWLDRIIDRGVALGLGVLTSFFVSGSESLLISIGAYAASQTTALGTQLANLIARRDKRLRELANAGPGRLERNWGGLR